MQNYINAKNNLNGCYVSIILGEFKVWNQPQ